MATTTTLSIDADNWLYEAGATSAYGGGALVQIGIGGAIEKRHGIFQVDVSSFTNPADIVSAVFTLTATASAGTTQNNMVLQRLTQSFTEIGSNWNTYDGTNGWTTAGAYDDIVAGETTYAVQVGTTADIVVDIKELVIDAINRRSGSLQFIIYFNGTPSSSGYTKFASRTNGTTENRPSLAITVASRYSWTGTVDGDLDSYRNWNPTTVPTANDIAIIAGGNEIDRGSLTCKRAYVSEGYTHDLLKPSGSSVTFTVDELRINKKRGQFHINCATNPTVYIANNSATTSGSKLIGTYKPIVMNTRSEVYLAGTGGDTVICASESNVKAKGATACDAVVNGGRYVAEGGCNDMTIASGAKLRSEGGNFSDVFIASGSHFNHKAGTLTGDIVIYDGKMDFKNNESAAIETEDVTVWRNGIFDARTSTGSHDPQSEVYCRGGNFIVDVGKSLTIG